MACADTSTDTNRNLKQIKFHVMDIRVQYFLELLPQKLVGISDKYVAAIFNKSVAVISDKFVAVISNKHVVVISAGRKPNN